MADFANHGSSLALTSLVRPEGGGHFLSLSPAALNKLLRQWIRGKGKRGREGEQAYSRTTTTISIESRLTWEAEQSLMAVKGERTRTKTAHSLLFFFAFRGLHNFSSPFLPCQVREIQANFFFFLSLPYVQVMCTVYCCIHTHKKRKLTFTFYFFTLSLEMEKRGRRESFTSNPRFFMTARVHLSSLELTLTLLISMCRVSEWMNESVWKTGFLTPKKAVQWNWLISTCVHVWPCRGRQSWM